MRMNQSTTSALIVLVSMLVLLQGCDQRAQQPDNAPRETSATKKTGKKGNSSETTTQPLEGEAEKETENLHTLEGTIEKIRLQNINKAAGHYTYNVELRIRATSIEPEHHGTDIEGNPIEVFTVRIGKLYWKNATDAQKQALAPDGPKSTLDPPKYNNYEVGQKVSLKVQFSSGALAFIAQ